MKADVVICGAGIAGISAAYELAVRRGITNVVLVDDQPPLSVTSDKSTESYRNWWPGPGDEMVRFMNRSIDLLEELAHETDNVFLLNRRGYMFMTADAQRGEEMRQRAEVISALGAGALRVHREGVPGREPYTRSPAETFANQPTGADLLIGSDLIRQHYPFLTEDVQVLLHTRRCGSLSAQQLGMYKLEQAKAKGVRFLSGRVTDIIVKDNRVQAVQVGETTIQTSTFVNAAGPFIQQVADMMGVDLPIYNELHAKVSFNDHLGILPRDIGLTIWEDPTLLGWTKEERAELAGDESLRWLVDWLPAGVHFKPEGAGTSNAIVMLWTYDLHKQDPIWPPPPTDEFYPEIVLRGLVRMIPALEAYVGNMSRPYVDSGYYCKTEENRLLVSPLPVEGAYLIGAFSGYGIMASSAAADLLGAYIANAPLPSYAPAFHLDRYDSPAYQVLLKQWGASGQL